MVLFLPLLIWGLLAVGKQLIWVQVWNLYFFNIPPPSDGTKFCISIVSRLCFSFCNIHFWPAVDLSVAGTEHTCAPAFHSLITLLATSPFFASILIDPSQLKPAFLPAFIFSALYWLGFPFWQLTCYWTRLCIPSPLSGSHAFSCKPK